MKFKKAFAGMTAVLLMCFNLSMIPVSAADTYRDVLYSVLNTQKYGDVEFPSSDNISEETFAIADINGDGKKELIISFKNTITAWQKKVIFGKDNLGNIYCEADNLGVSCDFYNNGVLKSYLSHNQSLSSVFYPYQLMQYHSQSGTYEPIATVEAWNKSEHATNYEGTTFPDSIDTSGTGQVYQISIGDTYNQNYVDSSTYRSWLGQYTDSASGWVAPQYWYLTTAGIDYVCELQETNDSPIQTADSGDHNHDGRVDATDAAYILQYAAEIGAGNFTGTLDEYMQNFTSTSVITPTEVVEPPVVTPTEIAEKPDITGYVKVVYPEDLGIVGDGCTFYFVATGGNYDYYRILYTQKINGEDRLPSDDVIQTSASECKLTAGSDIESVTAYVMPCYNDGTMGELFTCTGRSKYY